MHNLFDNYSSDELLITNVQFLGLKKKSWEFSRGARTCRRYNYDNDSTAVKDCYTYVMENGDRDIASATRVLEWYDESGVLQISKDISPDLSVKDLKALNRAVRQGRLDWMEDAAEQLGLAVSLVPEPYKSDFQEASESIDILFEHYKPEIDQYIRRGTIKFENSVLNETNPVILRILALRAYIPDADFPNGLTIKESILYQLTGVIP